MMTAPAANPLGSVDTSFKRVAQESAANATPDVSDLP
jgi:hypothetical protein